MTNSTILIFLQIRNSTFYFRRKIPREIRSITRQSELVFSLRTSDKNLAIFRAALCMHLSAQYLHSLTSSNHQSLTLALKTRVREILSGHQHSLAPAPHPSLESWLIPPHMLLGYPRQAMAPTSLSYPLPFLDELFMADLPGIDPVFKSWLRTKLEDRARSFLTAYEDGLHTFPSLREELQGYEEIAAEFRASLTDSAPANTASQKEAGYEAVWQEASSHIGTSDPVAAEHYVRRQVTKTALKMAETIIRIIKDPDYSGVPSASSLTAPPAPVPIEPKSPKISAAWDMFKTEKQNGWRPETLRGYELYMAEFTNKEFVGDIHVHQLTRDMLVNYRNTLQRLPHSRTKKRIYRDQSVADLVKSKIPPEDLMADRTINERLIFLASFFDWCRIVRGYTDKELCYDLMIKNPESAERAAFTSADLAKLFDPNFYQPKLIDRPYKFWIPLLGLFSGARLSEIAQLHPDDVMTLESIPLIRVTDQGEDQNTKTKAGKRLIPIHPELISLGFLDYVDSMRKTKSGQLFPDLRKEAKAGGAASKWFTEFRRKRGVADTDDLGLEKVFHSFRHTVITQLMHKQLDGGFVVPVPVIQQIVGHEKSLFGETATYTKSFPLPQCKDVIDRLEFDIDIQSLKQCWELVIQCKAKK